MNELRIGTCSWKYPSWAGLVYSSAEKSINHLAEYATRYTTVEIDQWFWSLFGDATPVLPRQSVVAEYAAAIPEGFKFTIKVPNSITLTHPYKKKKEDELIPNPHFLSVGLFVEFLKTLLPLGSAVGPLMFQFEYLNKQKMPSQRRFLKEFGHFLSQLPEGYSYAVESRNPNYLNRAYFEFLNEHKASHVFIQGYYMPSVTEIYAKFRDYIRGTTVIRLHGYDRDDMEKAAGGVWNRIVEPKDAELDAILEMVRDLQKRKVNIFINVNNHYEGSAPLTINKIVERLG